MTNQSWKLGIRDIHYFWSILYPRMVSETWLQGVDPAWLRDGDHGKQFMQGLLAGYLENITSVPAREDVAVSNTVEILQSIISFFQDNEVGIIEGYNYEYILHDKGIDLPLVKKPEHITELFSNYRDRPTRNLPANLPGISDELNMVQTVDPFHGRRAHKEKLNGMGFKRIEETDPAKKDNFGSYGPWVESVNGADIESHMAKTANERKWQLRSSVLDNLQLAIPKFIARVWYDTSYALNLTGKISSLLEHMNDGFESMRPEPIEQFQLDERPYPVRKLLKQENGSKYAKEILGSYIERPMGGPYLSGFEIKPVLLEKGEEGQISLTENGLVVEIPHAPDMDEIFVQIAEGKAGNPMFTSSYSTNTG